AEFLPVGPYTVKVDAPGFTEFVQNGIVLTVTQQAALNYTLQAGGQKTVVEVTSQVPLVNLGNYVLRKTVNTRGSEHLPLVGRSVYDRLSRTAAVQSVQNENSSGLPMEHVIINGSTD